MSEATFQAHLNELRTVFGLLQTDFETGPKRDLGNWYDQMLDDIYASEDTIEDIINSRNNYDADSIDDSSTVEDDGSVQEEVNYSLEDEDALVDESDSEDLIDEDENIDEGDSEDNSNDDGIESHEDVTANEYIVDNATSTTNKPTIIKIIIH